MLLPFVFLSTHLYAVEPSVANEQLQSIKQHCFAALDQDQLKDYQSQAYELTKQIDFLCNESDRNKAQNLATGFAITLQKSPLIRQYRRCAKIPPSNHEILQKYFVSDLRFTHICDQKIKFEMDK